jgi:hypothetical protein
MELDDASINDNGTGGSLAGGEKQMATPLMTQETGSVHPSPDNPEELNFGNSDLVSQQADAASEAGDDVNALSATSNQASSYVGPSSTMQMFRTILRIAPESLAKLHPSQSPSSTRGNGSQSSPEVSQQMQPSSQMTERAQALVDAYFYWIHPATPVLDETVFRKTASANSRNDAPWLCLFNMVLTLGSIGCTRADSREHMTYYRVAKSHLDLESLGNKCLETLQSLILMAGWYGHYRNRPNLASALLGAAFRMAYALGLHKEPGSSNLPVEIQDLRRQIWWNLVVLDAAEAMTLGRTLDTGIFESEVRLPQEAHQNVCPFLAAALPPLNSPVIIKTCPQTRY